MKSFATVALCLFGISVNCVGAQQYIGEARKGTKNTISSISVVRF